MKRCGLSFIVSLAVTLMLAAAVPAQAGAVVPPTYPQVQGWKGEPLTAGPSSKYHTQDSNVFDPGFDSRPSGFSGEYDTQFHFPIWGSGLFASRLTDWPNTNCGYIDAGGVSGSWWRSRDVTASDCVTSGVAYATVTRFSMMISPLTADHAEYQVSTSMGAGMKGKDFSLGMDEEFWPHGGPGYRHSGFHVVYAPPAGYFHHHEAISYEATPFVDIPVVWYGQLLTASMPTTGGGWDIYQRVELSNSSSINRVEASVTATRHVGSVDASVSVGVPGWLLSDYYDEGSQTWGARSWGFKLEGGGYVGYTTATVAAQQVADYVMWADGHDYIAGQSVDSTSSGSGSPDPEVPDNSSVNTDTAGASVLVSWLNGFFHGLSDLAWPWQTVGSF